MDASSPYHTGEREVQERAGQAARAAATGRAISDVIIPAAWSFLADQQMVVLGSWDGGRNPWPTLVFGNRGFVSTRDGRQVRLDLSMAAIDRTDPAWDNLNRNGLLGLLAIELSTRRRLRINGKVDSHGVASFFDAPFEMKVVQAYPNCPKYIQRRTLAVTGLVGRVRLIGQDSSLSAEQMRLISVADTLFVASVHPAHGADVSHRGGPPSFVQVESPRRIRIPDYAGNSMFNTLGNIHASGVAGILFVDFDTGLMLQIAGDAEIDWQAGSCGIERSWTLAIREVRESLLPEGIQWRYLDASPFNP